MKISEIVEILKKELEKGDREVVLHGTYGATSEEFEVLTPEKDDGVLHVWTGIHTG